MDKLEEMCRIYCSHFGINPDQESVGLGAQMPEGERYKLWEYHREAMKKVLDFCGKV